jgi:hypothetical protein
MAVHTVGIGLQARSRHLQGRCNHTCVRLLVHHHGLQAHSPLQPQDGAERPSWTLLHIQGTCWEGAGGRGRTCMGQTGCGR